MKRPSPRRLVLRIAAVVVVAWGAAVAIALLGAQRDIRNGLDSVRAAQRAAAPKELIDGRPLCQLRDSRRSFQRAEDRLDGIAVRPLRIVPVVGRQLRSVTALAGAAADVSDIGADAVNDARRTLRQPHGTGPERVALLRDLAGRRSVVSGTGGDTGACCAGY